MPVFFWGCGSAPFLIGDFESGYKPKLNTVAIMPFSVPVGNRGAEENRPLLEETISGALVQGDSVRSYLFPSRLRARFGGMADAGILRLPADRAGKLLLAEALLYSEVIRLYQSAGDNPTTRGIGAAKFQRRGCELLMEFRLVEAASGKLLWKYRVRRFGKDAETASRLVAQAAAEAWPFGTWQSNLDKEGIDGCLGRAHIERARGF
ncbi:MAG: hypothetical protein L0Z48_00850 [candidate division Zixibacteria bacterium]|nr:hypothetical protein [candidate division Zixibacteria bacterium]MCI0595071.1 hypothetical protein [candidate division Zixibacteria bacterium]